MFSHKVLANTWARAGYTSINGRLTRGGQVIPIQEETDLWALLKLPWVEPWAREVSQVDEGQIDMSRGLGSLQREILRTLDKDHEADFVSHDFRTVYDLLAVKMTLVAHDKGRTDRLYVPELRAVYVWHTGAFTAAFSRAIRTLVKRGVLRSEYRATLAGDVDLYHTHFVSREPITVNSQ